MKTVFRALVEVIGKPSEYVEESIKTYLDKLKQDSRFQVLKEDVAEVKKQEIDAKDVKKQDNPELWAVFAELEVQTKDFSNLVFFCFEYMPSIIEILEPEEFTLQDVEVTHFINDLQARLHQVDLVAKQAKIESDHWKKNLHDLLNNYVILILRSGPRDSLQLSKLTGLSQDKLEDFLDLLIDKGRINLKEGFYSLSHEPKKAD